jgi:hypothetical protein
MTLIYGTWTTANVLRFCLRFGLGLSSCSSMTATASLQREAGA